MKSVPQLPMDRRVGDAERAATGETLSEALVSGQLSEAEFDERMSAALAARTRSELSVLTVDLAEPESPASGTPPPRPAAVVVELPVNPAKAIGFAAVLGAVSFVIVQALFGFTVDAESLWFWLLTWLFGTACGGAGSMLTNKHRRRA